MWDILNNIIWFVWWLWLFVLWVSLFDESTKKLVSQWFKNFIKKTTDTLFKSIWVGTLATMILQWSTAVLLIVVSFIAAGIIDFNSAIWLVLWANIWTPIVSVVLWNLWLRFSFATIAVPIACVAALGMFLCSKNKKLKSIFKLIVWLALLFRGLGEMNTNMEIISEYVDFVKLASYPLFLFFFISLALTVMTQSSSITIVLALTAANSGLVDYRMWIMLILWAFLWTTSTTLLWAMWWSYLKKQVSYSHFFLNLFSSVLWFLFINIFVRVLEKINVDIVLWLSIFAVWFKVITVLILLIFLKPFIGFIQKLFPKKTTHLWLKIETLRFWDADAALLAVHDDDIKLLKKVFKYILNIWSIDEREILDVKEINADFSPREELYDKYHLEIQYNLIKEIEQSLVLFQTNIKKSLVEDEDDRDISEVSIILADIVSAAKYMKDVSIGVVNMQYSPNKRVLKKYYDFRRNLSCLYKDVSLIIDGENDNELLENLISLMDTIKMTDEEFMEEFTWTISENWSDQTILSDSLHVNRYFYLSCLKIVSALKLLFLTSEQRQYLEKIE